MKIKIFLSLILFSILTMPSFAEKIPVRIEPIQVISTHHDEVEVGDKIKFTTTKDVMLNGKIYIKASTNVYALVDFVHNNGWAGDNAEIKFNKFITQNINGEKIIIKYPISLKGCHEKANIIKTFLADITILVRGAEIYIEPDSMYVNIFITR